MQSKYLSGCYAWKGLQRELLQHLFGYWARTNDRGSHVILLPLSSHKKKTFQTTPTKQDLGPLRGCFQNFQQAFLSLLYVSLPWGHLWNMRSVMEMASATFFQIAVFKSTCDFIFCSLVRKLSSKVSFSVILNKDLSSFWVNNSWNFINDLQYSEIFAVRHPLTFFDHNKISSCTFIIFIMGKINFSFIEELKSKHKQKE